MAAFQYHYFWKKWQRYLCHFDQQSRNTFHQNWYICNLYPILSEIDGIVSLKVEVSLDSCEGMSWNELKRFLSPCHDLEVLRVINTPLMDEDVMEQFSIRFQKSLMELHLENLPLLTNKGLYEIARRFLLINFLLYFIKHIITKVLESAQTEVGVLQQTE